MLNKEDFVKIEKNNSKAKKTDSAVYSTLNGKTNFHPLEKLKVGVEELGKILENQDGTNKEVQEKITILKNGIVEIDKELKKINILLAKYGIE